MKIDISEDCGNSPRETFIKEFNLAFAKGDVDFIIKHLHPDIEWEMVGNLTLNGTEAVRDFLEKMAAEKTESFTIQTIITHGRDVSSNGTITFQNGETVAFCDVFRFSDTKHNMIQKIQSYGISTS